MYRLPRLPTYIIYLHTSTYNIWASVAPLPAKNPEHDPFGIVLESMSSRSTGSWS
jgi:hypothetical protein